MNIDIVNDTLDGDLLLFEFGFDYDKRRLKSFLENPSITDAIFFKLLKIYDWEGKGFFEDSDNSDVSTALIKRVYKNFNHNIDTNYKIEEFTHLITNCNKASIIETIVQLEPLQRTLQRATKDANYTILTSIATHHLTPKSVLNMLIEKADSYMKTLIAMREDCNEEMQTLLYEDGDTVVCEVLSHKVNLDISIAIKLLFSEIFGKNVARYIKLSDEMFEILDGLYSVELARNESLDLTMQKKLLSSKDERITTALALNETIHEYTIAELICVSEENITSYVPQLLTS